MPRIPSERSYDDITYKAGDNRTNTSGSFSPFTFLCISLILTLLGLVVLYSASYPKAISLGYPHYFYFLRQVCTAVIAVVVGALVTLMPLQYMSKFFAFLLPVALVSLVITLIPGFSFGSLLAFKGIPIFNPSSFAVFAAVFTAAGLLPYTDEERSVRCVVSAAISLIALEILILFSGGLPWFVLSSVILLLMLRRVRIPKLVLILAFISMVLAAAGAAMALPELLSPMYSTVIPVVDESLYDAALSVSSQAIADGGIVGTGLGSGLYKLGEMISPESQFIFAIFSEELGGIGTIFILFLFIIYLVIGVRTSKRAIEKESGFAVSLSYGLSLMIALKALCNLLYVSGLLPLSGIMLPFFSYSIEEEAITMLSTVFLYKLAYKMGREHES